MSVLGVVHSKSSAAPIIIRILRRKLHVLQIVDDLKWQVVPESYGTIAAEIKPDPTVIELLAHFIG